MTNLPAEIGKRIKAARVERRLTQEEVGTFLGIGRAGYANIETGRSLIQVDHLVKLPGILRKPMMYFLGDNGNLAPDESELLQLYRSIPQEFGKKTILEMTKSMVALYSQSGSSSKGR